MFLVVWRASVNGMELSNRESQDDTVDSGVWNRFSSMPVFEIEMGYFK